MLLKLFPLLILNPVKIKTTRISTNRQLEGHLQVDEY